MTLLEWGDYKITEIRPNDGYTVFSEDPSFTFRVWGGVDGTIDWVLETDTTNHVIRNYKTNIQIGVEETRDSGTKKGGVKYSITGVFANDTAASTKEYESSSTAMEELKGQLIIGTTYTLKQTERPAGCEAWNEPVRFHLDPTGNIVFETGSPADLSDGYPAARVADKKSLWLRNTVVNAKLRIEKTGAGGIALENVTFKLYRKSDGSEIAVSAPGIKTNADGYWESDPATLNLPEGEYYLKETWTTGQSGLYKENTEPIPFIVTATDHFATSKTPVTVRVVNVPKLNLIDVNTSDSPLNGYQFEVTGIFNGAVPGADPGVDVTAEQTFILTKETLEDFNKLLKPGETYTMKQVAINSGYYLDGSITFTVKNDFSLEMTDNAEYKFDDATGTLIVINRPIPAPSGGGGGIGGDTPPDEDGKGGPGEEGGEGDPDVPTYTAETDVPDPVSPEAPLVIMLVRDGEAKLFYKTWWDNRYVYMAEDGEVLGYRLARGGQTGDPIRTDWYIMMAAVGSLGVLVATGNHSKKRKKKERVRE